MAYLTQHQGMENFLESLVRDHQRYEPIVQFLDNIVLNSKDLTWTELEVIGWEVANAAGSEFCAQLRKGMVNALEPSSETIHRLEACKKFARDLVASPKSIDASRIDGLRAAGMSDQGIEDVIGWVCILQLYAVLDQALGFTGLPQEVLNEIADGTVGAKGYVPSFQYFVGMVESTPVSKPGIDRNGKDHL